MHMRLPSVAWDVSKVEALSRLSEELTFTGYCWMIPVWPCSVFIFGFYCYFGQRAFWRRLKAIRRAAGRHRELGCVVKHWDFLSLLWVCSSVWFIQLRVCSAYQTANLDKQAINRLITLPDTPREFFFSFLTCQTFSVPLLGEVCERVRAVGSWVP